MPRRIGSVDEIYTRLRKDGVPWWEAISRAEHVTGQKFEWNGSNPKKKPKVPLKPAETRTADQLSPWQMVDATSPEPADAAPDRHSA